MSHGFLADARPPLCLGLTTQIALRKPQRDLRQDTH